MVAPIPHARPSRAIGAQSNRVSSNQGLCFRETEFYRQRRKAQNSAERPRTPSQRTYPRELSGQIGANCRERGNLSERRNAWWAREDSNLQPSGYEPLALTIELRARAARAFIVVFDTTRLSERAQRSDVDPARGNDDSYPRRLNKNTACSPNRFQNHHGIFNRIRRPQALSATASSIFARET
jgi:hypothetical protein